MSFACRDVRSRFSRRPQHVIWTLIGLGCVRVGLALAIGSGLLEVSHTAAAAQWISGAGSLILVALLDWDLRERHPGMTSLFRRYSRGTIAGSLLPIAAGQVFPEWGAVPALAGLALTLCSALLLEWLLRPICLDGLPSESLGMARPEILSEVLEHCAGGRQAWVRKGQMFTYDEQGPNDTLSD